MHLQRFVSIKSVCGMALMLTLVSAASAQSRLAAHQNPAGGSMFTLDFGPYGASNANISITQFALDVDGPAGTARFVNYFQHVDPLTLPGGFSTGDIRVRVLPGSSSGTYDPSTGAVSTDEFYEISFTGDLSAYGLTSPVYLPGSSLGQVTFSSPDSGSIELVWDGVGQLPNPDPTQPPITFSYECATSTVFAPGNAGDMNCDEEVDQLDIQGFVDAISDPFVFTAQFPDCNVNNADVNGDGSINTFDINGFVELLGG